MGISFNVLLWEMQESAVTESVTKPQLPQLSLGLGPIWFHQPRPQEQARCHTMSSVVFYSVSPKTKLQSHSRNTMLLLKITNDSLIPTNIQSVWGFSQLSH